MWCNKRGYFLEIVILVKFDLGFEVIGIKAFVFDPKHIKRQGRRNREGLEYALGHAFEAVKGKDY